MQPNNSNSLSQLDRSEKVTKYLYCWASDYFLKWHCQVFQDNLNSNQIHIGDNQKVCLKPYISGARHIFIRQEKPGQESIADAKKLCYLFLSLANIQTLRIDDGNLDLYLSDDKV